MEQIDVADVILLGDGVAIENKGLENAENLYTATEAGVFGGFLNHSRRSIGNVNPIGNVDRTQSGSSHPN